MRNYIPKNLRDLPLYKKTSDLLLWTLVADRTFWTPDKQYFIGDMVEPASQTGYEFFFENLVHSAVTTRAWKKRRISDGAIVGTILSPTVLTPSPAQLEYSVNAFNLSAGEAFYVSDGDQSHTYVTKLDLNTFTMVEHHIVTPAAEVPAYTFQGEVDGMTIYLMNQCNVVGDVLWNFGDGNTSTEMNPVHTYRVPGIYTVSLHIVGHTALQNFNIAGTPNHRIVHFTQTSTQGQVKPITVYFENDSNFTGTTITFDFGDGTHVLDPVGQFYHDYAYAGIYHPVMYVTDVHGTVYSKESLLVVSDPKAAQNLTPISRVSAATYSASDQKIYAVSQDSSCRVAKIRANDTYTEAVLEVSPTVGGRAIANDASNIYVLLENGTVAKIDKATFTLKKTITLTLPNNKSFHEGYDLLVNEDTRIMYVSYNASAGGSAIVGLVGKIDLFEFAQTYRMNTTAANYIPQKIAVNKTFGEFYVIGAGPDSEVARYRTSDLSLIDKTAVVLLGEAFPRSMVVDEVNHYVEVAGTQISRIDYAHTSTETLYSATPPDTTVVTLYGIQVVTGYLFECVQPGVSDSVEPTWSSTIDAQLVDRNVVWRVVTIDNPNIELYRAIINKYKNVELLDEETIREIVSEFGLGYILDVLDTLRHKFTDIGSLLYFIAFMHIFKGHRQGLSFLLRFFNFGYFQIREWWQYAGTPDTARITISVDPAIYDTEAKIVALENSMRGFLANYVYPICDVIVAFYTQLESEIPSYHCVGIDGSTTTVIMEGIVTIPEIPIFNSKGLYGGLFGGLLQSEFGMIGNRRKASPDSQLYKESLIQYFGSSGTQLYITWDQGPDDKGPNQELATLVGAQPTWRPSILPSQHGSSGLFANGGYQYGNLVCDFEYDVPFSILVWTKLNGAPSSIKTIFDKKLLSTNRGYTFTFEPGYGGEKPTFRMGDYAVNNGLAVMVRDVGDLYQGTHFIVFTYDGSNTTDGMLIYTDGVLNTLDAMYTSAIVTSVRSAQSFGIGYNADYPTRSYDEQMDELAIYNKVITPAQIAAYWAYVNS